MRKMKNKATFYMLIAVAIVFAFALGCFVSIKVLNRGQAAGEPVAEVRQNNEWMLIRAPFYLTVDPNVAEYEFIYEEGSDECELVLKYNVLDRDTYD